MSQELTKLFLRELSLLSYTCGSKENERMRQGQLRTFMLKNRVFLHSLYSDNKTERTHRLNVCSNYQANVLLHILRKIVLGELPLEKEHFERLKKSRKLFILNELKSEDTFKTKLKGSRTEKAQYLKKLNLLFPSLLHYLFYKQSA